MTRWDYVRTALREHHELGTLDDYDRTDGALVIRLQVPACRPATIDAVALSACDSAPWLFEHMSVDRIRYELSPVTDDGTDAVSITAKRDWFDDDGTEATDRLLESVTSMPA